MILQVQKVLNANGFGVAETGTMTDETMEALEAWQQMNGVPVTGSIDVVTLQKMNLDQSSATSYNTTDKVMFAVSVILVGLTIRELAR